MEFQDTGFLIAAKKFQENKYLLTFFTKDHGLVKGMGRISRKAPIDLGDLCAITWHARLEEHLGTLHHEKIQRLPVAFLSDSARLQSIQSACQMLYHVTPAHHIYLEIYDIFKILCDEKIKNWAFFYIQFELLLLKHAGFGLALEYCVVTKRTDHLSYISPKSGGAVCESIGDPYKDKLFKKPYIFYAPDAKDMKEALNILGYFWKKHIFFNRLPFAREYLEKLDFTHLLSIEKSSTSYQFKD